MKNYWTFLIVAILLTACATAAQKQAETTITSAKATIAQFKVCMTNVYDQPDYSNIIAHIPTPAQVKPTMAQLADNAKPTKEESELLIHLHDDAEPCKQQLLSELQPILPTVADLLATGMVEGDKLSLQLLQRKITWGIYNQRLQDIVNTYRPQLLAAIQKAGHNLAIQDRQERAERDAAIKAPFQIAGGVIASALVIWGNAHAAPGNPPQTVRLQTSCNSNTYNGMTFTNCN